MDSIVEAVAAAAARRPDAAAVIAERQEITYGELWREIRGFAAYIRSFGFEKGARIVVKSKHSIWYVVALFGVHLSGCVFVPLGKTVGMEGLKDIAGQLSASMIVSDVDIEGGGYVTVDPASVRALAADSFDEALRFDFPRPEDLCEIIFTTGTTGRSKGVMLTHGADVAIVEDHKSGYDLSEDDVHLVANPLDHVGGLRRMYVSLFTGTAVALLDGFANLNLFFTYIRDYHVTSIYMPPFAVRMVLLLAAEEMAGYAGQLDNIHTGGTAFPEADKERFRGLLPRTRLYFTYGSSETGIVSMLEYSREKKGPCCVGKPAVHIRAFIVDDDRKEIRSSKDRPGLIAISGPSLMSGYYNGPELTKEVLVDGVLYTNDIGYFDEDGYLYVLGRRGDVIDMDGRKVAPTEVEDTALRFPGVAECACFAVQDAVRGAVLKMNIVEGPGADVQIRELREHMRGRLEAFKVPKWIEKVGAIPKTANGKIDRKVLK